MFRRNFLQLSIFGFLGSKFKNKIEPKLNLEIEPVKSFEIEPVEIWEKEPVKSFEIEEESINQIEEIVLNWLKSTKESIYTIRMTDGDSRSDFLTFFRSVVNIKSTLNTWQQWHIATAYHFPKMISFQVKEIGTNTSMEDGSFIMPNEVRSERYDGTSYI